MGEGRKKKERKERRRHGGREKEAGHGGRNRRALRLEYLRTKRLGHRASFLDVRWNDQPRGQKGRGKCVKLINHVVFCKSQGLGCV